MYTTVNIVQEINSRIFVAYNVVIRYGVKVMKTPNKKVLRGFRIAEEISSELKRRSDGTGISEARIVEDALKFHFARNMQDQLKKVIAAFEKGSKSNPKPPVTPFISRVEVVV